MNTQPFGACTLLVQPFVVRVLLADGTGTATSSLPIGADPAALGLRLDAQGLVWDPPNGIAGLFAASNGLEAILGPN